MTQGLALYLPVGDWQFWAVTAIFLAALVWILRGLLPVVSKRYRRKKRERRVSITVGGKSVK